MKSVLKVINNASTHLITCGNPFNCNGKDVIVCITGNPGIADFYLEFASELHKQTSLPVCVIGHAGHEEFPDGDFDKSQGQEKMFNLKGQVEHKLDVIKNHIDANSRIHIIGHSIGAWMIIELMHKYDFLQDKVSTTNLLFPTVQRMAESPNGVFLNKLVRNLHSIVLLSAYFLAWLPKIVYEFFINCYLRFHRLPSSYFERIHKFLKPKAVEHILFLAYDEMDTVVRLNVEGIKRLCPQTNVIFSVRDNWVPVNYMQDLKSIQPSIELKQVDISHAFVLKSSVRVASMVSEYIKPRINKPS